MSNAPAALDQITAPGDFRFRTAPSGIQDSLVAWIDGLTIANNGNVGVGTVLPTEQLHILGRLRIEDGTQSAGRVLTSDGTGRASWQTVPSSVAQVNAGAGITGGGSGNAVTLNASAGNGLTVDAASDQIQLGGNLSKNTAIQTGSFGFITNINGNGSFEVRDNGVAKLYVSDAGFVGIGTNNPRDDLEIGAGWVFRSAGGKHQSSNTYFTGGNWRYIATGAAFRSQIGTDGSYRLYNAASGTAGSTVNFAQRFSILNNGNVGIGVSSPSAKLHVAGSVRIVDGTQAANRVLTSDANGNASWQAPQSSLGDARTVNSGTVTALTPSKKYLVSVYGITRVVGNGNATMLAVRVTDCSNVQLASTPTAFINWPDGNAPQSASFVITAPVNGCIRGYTDNGLALSMTVVQLD